MTAFFDEPRRLRGTLITLDGPGGVGKSTATKLATGSLIAAGVPVLATAQPSRAPLGELARHGTDAYKGMALACLCAADRHQQLDAEIKPALCDGQVVICDRYVSSSLVLQGLDGLSAETVWQLTETKATAGSEFLAKTFAAAGYSVTFPAHAPGKLGVMVVSKVDTSLDPLGAALDFLPARAAGVVVETDEGPLRVVGAYVPSRDATPEKTERKKTWIEQFHKALDNTSSNAPLLMLGDLNVLEPNHQPAHHGQFAQFEYAFCTGPTERHGLADLFRHLHPDRVEHSWARAARIWATATTTHMVRKWSRRGS